jgi:hypothetical protein
VGERKAIETVNGGDNSIYSKNTNLDKTSIHIHGGMNTTWLGMPNITPMDNENLKK